MKIVFTNTSAAKLDEPVLASKLIPEWYKNTKSYVNDKKVPTDDGGTGATIKRCMPVFDAMTSGYIICSPADVYVSIKEYEAQLTTGEKIENMPIKKEQHFAWSDHGLISFHPIQQAPEHPARNEYAYPKWNNPWSIRTPKGYSTLFVQPFHRESIFTILPGIVDTDSYFAPVNFPFVINDPNFQGYIPKGTPIAQVIPVKREDWEMQLGKEKEFYEQSDITRKLSSTFYDRYKKMFWFKKSFD